VVDFDFDYFIEPQRPPVFVLCQNARAARRLTLLNLLIALKSIIIAYSWLDDDTYHNSYDYIDRALCCNGDEVTVMMIKHICSTLLQNSEKKHEDDDKQNDM